MSIQIIGHRGARGLLPELSLEGFNKCLKLGVDGIELDIGITADHKVVAYHDYTLNPDITRDKNGRWLKHTGPKICELLLKDIRTYDIGRIQPKSNYAKMFHQQLPVDGCKIPTLEEIVELVRQHKGSAKFCIEAKRSAVRPQLTVELDVFAETLVAEIDRLEITNQSIVQSFDWSLLKQIGSLQTNLEQWHLTSELAEYNTVSDHNHGVWTAGLLLSDYDCSIPKMIQMIGGSVWSCNFEALNATRIEEAHRLGLKVICWTANEDSDFERLIALGVNGITTDFPDRLIKYIRCKN